MRFGRLSVHPILGHIDGLIERDFGCLVVLGILDIAVFNEFLTGIHSFGQCGQQFTASQRQCFVLAKLVTNLSALSSDCCSSFFDSSNDSVAEEPFEGTSSNCPDDVLD